MRELKKYSSQFIKDTAKELTKSGHNFRSIPELSRVLDLQKSSVKFAIPDIKKISTDGLYSNLDIDMPLSLPFKEIEVEYTAEDEPGDGFFSNKRIIYAVEREEVIDITSVWNNFETGCWYMADNIIMPKKNFLERDRLENGWCGIRFNYGGHHSARDIASEVSALLCMLNALACCNVKAVKRHLTGVGSKMRSCIKNDGYYTLEVECSHQENYSGTQSMPSQDGKRSPREHIRRGHIRRLPSGKAVWVNSAIVSAGSGGVIRKDYAIKPRHAPSVSASSLPVPADSGRRHPA